MAKKTIRKPNLPQETLDRARRELAREGGTPTETVAPASSTTPSRATTPKVPARVKSAGRVDLREEYAYVIADLQQMALLAGAILVGLVVLSFFI